MSALGDLPRAVLADEAPKKGGNLRVAILGGSTADTLDAHNMITQPDSHRVMALYDRQRSGSGGAVAGSAVEEGTL